MGVQLLNFLYIVSCTLIICIFLAFGTSCHLSELCCFSSCVLRWDGDLRRCVGIWLTGTCDDLDGCRSLIHPISYFWLGCTELARRNPWLSGDPKSLSWFFSDHNRKIIDRGLQFLCWFWSVSSYQHFPAVSFFDQFWLRHFWSVLRTAKVSIYPFHPWLQLAR